MAKAVKETKGPVGEETPPAPDSLDLAQLVAAQAQTAALLERFGPSILATAARVQEHGERLDQAEDLLRSLAEVIVQQQAALQQALTRHR